MRKTALILSMIIVIAACQPTEEVGDLPTRAVLPSVTPSEEPMATQTETERPTATHTATVLNTPTPRNTSTPTLTPSQTYTPSNTPIPSETPDSTQAIQETSTAQVIEAPALVTFTPLPPGAIIVAARPTSTGTPEIVADVLITPEQFQEEMDRILADEERISRLQVEFVEDTGIAVDLTALSEGVFVTGRFTVPITLTGGGFNNFVQIGGRVDFEMEDGGEPSEAYVEAALTLVTPAVQEAFSFILDQRLGEGQHDLEDLQITDEVMAITLYVPEPGQE
jgi:hypothetical protein